MRPGRVGARKPMLAWVIVSADHQMLVPSPSTAPPPKSHSGDARWFLHKPIPKFQLVTDPAPQLDADARPRAMTDFIAKGATSLVATMSSRSRVRSRRARLGCGTAVCSLLPVHKPAELQAITIRITSGGSPHTPRKEQTFRMGSKLSTNDRRSRSARSRGSPRRAGSSPGMPAAAPSRSP